MSFQVDDTGALIQVTVLDEDTVLAKDLSTVITKQIWLGPPNGPRKEFDADFITDGTDGALQYETVAGDLDEGGTWTVQAYYVTAASKEKHSTVGEFTVYDNISE